VECDREALDVALACCLQVDAATARIVRIRDTKHLETMLVSAPLLPELLATGRVEVLEPARAIGFDADGMFLEGFSGQ